MQPQSELFVAFGMPNGMEWIVVLVVALLLFGRRLPEVMRSLGGSIKQFKQGMEDGTTEAKPPEANKPVEGSISRAETTAPAPPLLPPTQATTGEHQTSSTPPAEPPK